MDFDIASYRVDGLGPRSYRPYRATLPGKQNGADTRVTRPTSLHAAAAQRVSHSAPGAARRLLAHTYLQPLLLTIPVPTSPTL
eukprot:181388-Chlamydomonas_euryale.AAC.3